VERGWFDLGQSVRCTHRRGNDRHAGFEFRSDFGFGRIEHELLRNLLLSAAFNYANQDYQNFGRVDNVYGVNLMGNIC